MNLGLISLLRYLVPVSQFMDSLRREKRDAVLVSLRARRKDFPSHLRKYRHMKVFAEDWWYKKALEILEERLFEEKGIEPHRVSL